MIFAGIFQENTTFGHFLFLRDVREMRIRGFGCGAKQSCKQKSGLLTVPLSSHVKNSGVLTVWLSSLVKTSGP